MTRTSVNSLVNSSGSLFQCISVVLFAVSHAFDFNVYMQRDLQNEIRMIVMVAADVARCYQILLLLTGQQSERSGWEILCGDKYPLWVGGNLHNFTEKEPCVRDTQGKPCAAILSQAVFHSTHISSNEDHFPIFLCLRLQEEKCVFLNRFILGFSTVALYCLHHTWQVGEGSQVGHSRTEGFWHVLNFIDVSDMHGNEYKFQI